MNRKRSHDDLDDADECLPISKRINSLHLEGKAQRIHPQHQWGANATDGFCNQETMVSENGASVLSPDIPYQDLNQHDAVRYRDPSLLAQRLSVHTDIASNCNSSHPSHSFHSSPLLMNNIAVSNHESYACDNHQGHHSHEPPSPFHPGQAPFASHHIMNPDSVVDVHYAAHMNGHAAHMNGHTSASNFVHHLPSQNLPVISDEDIELPNGPYEPELGLTENPHYFNTNKLLYEAHISRLRRILPDYQLHS